MRVEIEERIALVPKKIMAAARSSARDANALWELQCRLQRYMVCRRDFFDAQPDAENYECRLELVIGVFLGRCLDQCIGIHITVVWSRIYSQASSMILVCERSVAR